MAMNFMIGGTDREFSGLIASYPGVYDGIPVVAGTRFPVDFIRQRIDGGETPAELVADTDGQLTLEQVEAACRYAGEHPGCGMKDDWSDSDFEDAESIEIPR